MKTTHTNETKHTPGPWETARSHSGRNIYKQTQRDFDTKETRMLAFLVRNEDYFPVEESDANARLMASAPELLAALELALATIERLDVKHGPFSSTQGTRDVVSAAIARATS